MIRRLLAIGVLGAACLMPAFAEAAERLVLSSDDPELARAVDASLAPAGITVVVVAPTSGVAEPVARGAALAEREGAEAVVWIADSGDAGATLVVYDRDMNRALVRPLAFRPPLTPAQAASAARTARTMLRALRVTPDINVPPPTSAAAPAIRRRAERAHLGELSPPRSAWSVEAGGGVRGVWGDVSAEPHLVLGASRSAGPVVITVEGSIGPGVELARGGFAGTIADDAATLLVGAPVSLAGRLELAASAGVGLHLTRVDGTYMDGAITEIDVNPALRARVAVAWRVGRAVDIALVVGVDLLLRRQAYFDGAAEILAVPRADADAVLGVRLFLP